MALSNGASVKTMLNSYIYLQKEQKNYLDKPYYQPVSRQYPIRQEYTI